jgi:farnesyl diphosphate synthase
MIFLPHRQSEVMQLTNTYLKSQIEALPVLPSQLREAMEYALLSQGKRVRPLLITLVCDTFAIPLNKALPLLGAIECIHAYSLVHDDLPAMDDDDLRRGQPTCHKQYPEGIAILVGDALQTLAFDIIMHSTVLSSDEKVQCTQILTRAAGYHGMCGGQAIDLDATDVSIDIEQLTLLHNLKTGALLTACVTMAVQLVPDLPEATRQALRRYSQAVGLAFQVQDDILDVISDSVTLGKPSGSDTDLNKSTFPALMGLEAAQAHCEALLEAALQACVDIPENTQGLEDFAKYIIQRKH